MSRRIVQPEYRLSLPFSLPDPASRPPAFRLSSMSESLEHPSLRLSWTIVHRLLRLAGASLIFRPQASNIKWTCVEIERAVKMKMIPTSCVEGKIS